MNLVPFGSVCSLQNGRAFKPEEWSASGTPIVRIQNLNDETKPFNYCDFEVEKRFHVDSGDLLFSWSGTPGTSFGAFFWNRGKGFLNQHIFRVDIDERHIDKNYLRYAINSKLDLIIDQAHGGVGLKHITKGKLEAVEIPLPPLPEQKRIAAILDKADAIRRKRQQAIQLADDFLRAVFLDMFGDPVTNPKGWDVKPLSAGIRSISSGWSASGENRPCSDGEKGVLKISAVTSGVFKPEENKTVPLDQIPEGKKLLFPKRGDLLFSRANTRELVAASCIVMTDVEDVFLPDKLWLVETDQKKLLPEFLNYLLWQPRFKERLTSQATGTSGSMLNISKSKFEETDAFFPNMELQEKFKRIYWALQETLDASASSREAGDSLFESLSQKAFSGQL